MNTSQHKSEQHKERSQQFGSLQTLDFFCSKQPSLKTKISILTFSTGMYSVWFERILMLIEYFQLASQFLVLSSNTDDTKSHDYSFLNVINDCILKLANPSYFLSNQETDSTLLRVMLVVIGFIVMKYMLVVCVIYIAWYDVRGCSTLVNAWRYTLKMQARLTYFLITSFWIRIIQILSYKGFSLNNINDSAVNGILIGMTIMEYMFSLFTETQFCYMLETKDYLSSKDYNIQVTTLTQKFFYQMVTVLFGAHSTSSIWIFICVSLLLNITKIRWYLHYITSL